jgi:large subunit ribosomal protein L14e
LSIFEVGRLCIKTTGRDEGNQCVIVDIVDRNYVLVTGPEEKTGVRRRRVNVRHLKPLEESINIPQGASDEEIIEALDQQ